MAWKNHTPRKFPYWKVQYYVDLTMSWKPVQKLYYDIEDAREAGRKLKKDKKRLIQVNGEGSKTRFPVEL